ncbi:MAG TPA: alpha/beta hydrolase [Chloroflexia bacterium]|nr:alpha/beta hydrolase [Chloroflexia bacterium]
MMLQLAEGSIEANGLTVHYYRAGTPDGAPLLLLHGISDNGACWPLVARDLAGQYDVIMPDARGHGRTAGPVAGFGVPLLAADAAALIRALQLRPLLVWGHSMGAITAAALAASEPGLVRTVVLEDPPLVGDPPHDDPDDGAWRDQMVMFLAQVAVVPQAERTAWAAARNPGADPAEIAAWIDSKLEFNQQVLDQPGAALRRYPWRGVLAQIQCPALLITGDPTAGAIVTPATAAEAAGLMRLGEVANISRAGHSIHREHYAETLPAVRAFLHRH